jgi:iron complex transport system ATP-binding protein
MSTLELRNIVAGYGGSQVLRGVSLESVPGRVTALLGPNGVGKTTLLNVALGWKRPAEGEVLVNGDQLASLAASARGRAIGLVPQAEHIAFEYTILEYILLGRSVHTGPIRGPGEDDLRIALAALERVGLAGMESRGVLETSAGERQLVLLARAIAQDPGTILLDEPSAHLDLQNKRALIELIRAEAAAGRALLLTAHEPEFAAAVADRVVLLRDGLVYANGTPPETLTAENLSTVYRTGVQVKEIEGRRVFLW